MNANAGWTIESWNAFWSAPSIEIARTRVPSVVHPDVVGYWPRQKPIHGVTDYLQRIVDILTMAPDLRLKLEEHASNGEYTFARWSARGTGPSGRFDITGCDRVQVRNGIVIENRIISDAELFEQFARYVGKAPRSAA